MVVNKARISLLINVAALLGDHRQFFSDGVLRSYNAMATEMKSIWWFKKVSIVVLSVNEVV